MKWRNIDPIAVTLFFAWGYSFAKAAGEYSRGDNEASAMYLVLVIVSWAALQSRMGTR